MGKVISYRRKLIELARIYKIEKILDQNLKHTTYEIEIILLKNNVPIPSRRGYFSHKFINEILKPSYGTIKNLFDIDFNLITRFKKNLFYFSKKKLSINININKYIKKFTISIEIFFKIIFSNISNYFKFIAFNIVNFFKILSKTIIESLNDIYNFKVKEKILKSIFIKYTVS